MQLYDTLYDVNRELIRKNYLFKMHVSKWFQFILEDVISENVPCQLALMKELLEDNQFFTSNFITEEIIEYLTTCFSSKTDNKEYTEKKYLQIFQLMCISGKKVNTNNQKIILEHFLKKIHNNHSLYEVRLIEEDGIIKVIASLDKKKQEKFAFGQFKYQCEQHDNTSAWLYFVEYLNLMADLAQGRNKITEMELIKLFPLPLLGNLF